MRVHPRANFQMCCQNLLFHFLGGLCWRGMLLAWHVSAELLPSPSNNSKSANLGGNPINFCGTIQHLCADIGRRSMLFELGCLNEVRMFSTFSTVRQCIIALGIRNVCGCSRLCTVLMLLCRGLENMPLLHPCLLLPSAKMQLAHQTLCVRQSNAGPQGHTRTTCLQLLRSNSTQCK